MRITMCKLSSESTQCADAYISNFTKGFGDDWEMLTHDRGSFDSAVQDGGADLHGFILKIDFV